ncbi:MAG: 5'/3'-nucleotidase SurE, partial [Gammaproteobacteria bacterium]|nr:5'/3'-nucleotidase SurE [Gammaproteobacteria bacterium]
MNILLSNDDGYYAKGIEMLFDVLSQFANVTMVAPENNCSGASSSLTLKNPLRIRKFKDEGYYINGTPSDCVFMALTRILQDPPDLLVSGINHGANLGDDVLYSGTVGAALGGRFLNIPCLAISITSLKPNHLETAVRVSSEL